MTIKELESLSFEFRGNEMMKNGCHTLYYNKKYGIGVIVEEKWIRKGLRVSQIFKYKGKLYRKIERFLEVIKDIEFVALSVVGIHLGLHLDKLINDL